MKLKFSISITPRNPRTIFFGFIFLNYTNDNGNENLFPTPLCQKAYVPKCEAQLRRFKQQQVFPS